MAGGTFADECGTAAKAINLDLASTRSLLSADQQWRFTSVSPKALDQVAVMYIQNRKTFHKWNIGSIERNGRAFLERRQ